MTCLPIILDIYKPTSPTKDVDFGIPPGAGSAVSGVLIAAESLTGLPPPARALLLLTPPVSDSLIHLVTFEVDYYLR